jgi:hypothetical protein
MAAVRPSARGPNLPAGSDVLRPDGRVQPQLSLAHFQSQQLHNGR